MIVIQKNVLYLEEYKEIVNFGSLSWPHPLSYKQSFLSLFIISVFSLQLLNLTMILKKLEE